MAFRAAFVAFVGLSLTSAAHVKSDCPAHGNAEEASLLATHRKVHRGFSASQAENAASSASTLAFASTSTNVCQPKNGCNVCKKCCFSYIPDGPSCDSCVADQCSSATTTAPTTTTSTVPLTTTTTVKNVCQPENVCNVCTECCYSYIPDGPSCDSCVAHQCSSATTTVSTTTRSIVTTTMTTTTSSLAVSCSDLKDRCKDSIGSRGVPYGGCPTFGNNFAASCYSKYDWPSEDYKGCTSVIAMIYKDCLDTIHHPYYRDDCKNDVCDEIEPNPNKDASGYCQNIEKVCRSSFYYGPVPYGRCPDWLFAFQSTCQRKVGGSECSWRGELLSQQSTGCFNAKGYMGYTESDCVKAAGC